MELKIRLLWPHTEYILKTGVEFLLKRPLILAHFLSSAVFSFSELGNVSYCLVAVYVHTVEASSQTLLFCRTFHSQDDSLLVG
jgi:hypothetical protein